MDNATAYARFQAGEITLDELAEIALANATAAQEAANIAMHGTANSVIVYTDIRPGR